MKETKDLYSNPLNNIKWGWTLGSWFCIELLLASLLLWNVIVHWQISLLLSQVNSINIWYIKSGESLSSWCMRCVTIIVTQLHVWSYMVNVDLNVLKHGDLEGSVWISVFKFLYSPRLKHKPWNIAAFNYVWKYMHIYTNMWNICIYTLLNHLTMEYWNNLLQYSLLDKVYFLVNF